MSDEILIYHWNQGYHDWIKVRLSERGLSVLIARGGIYRTPDEYDNLGDIEPSLDEVYVALVLGSQVASRWARERWEEVCGQ